MLMITNRECPDSELGVAQLGDALSSSVAGLKTSICSHEATNLVGTGKLARFLYVGVPKHNVE